MLEPHQIEWLLAAGAHAYLTKPLNVKQFLGAVDGALSASATGSPATAMAGPVLP